MCIRDRRYGFTITANKDGRKVVSYTMIAEPANAAELRAAQPKAPKAKVAKTPKVKAPKANIAQPTSVPKAAPANAEDVKAKNLETLRKVAKDMGMKKVAAKKPKASKKTREFDDVTEQFGTSGEVATSFSVDKDWDSIDGVDLSKII